MPNFDDRMNDRIFVFSKRMPAIERTGILLAIQRANIVIRKENRRFFFSKKQDEYLWLEVDNSSPDQSRHFDFAKYRIDEENGMENCICYTEQVVSELNEQG